MERSEKLLTSYHRVASDPHIEIDEAACANCREKGCLWFCPAGCFSLDDGEVKFQYEGCFECGTCRAMCDSSLKLWRYPHGGCGVVFRVG